MAKQGFDFKKLLVASFLSIAGGLVLAFISIILQLLSLAISDSTGEIIDLASSAYAIVLFPIFLVLFFWTGMRAAKNYQFDLVGAGGVAAFSYFVVGFVERLLNIVLAVVVVSRPLGGTGFGSTEMVLASSLFGGMTGLSGVALSALCGFGMLAIGSTINFVVGGFGALFALRKSS